MGLGDQPPRRFSERAMFRGGVQAKDVGGSGGGSGKNQGRSQLEACERVEAVAVTFIAHR